jgi:hypothetical protein
MDGLLNITSLVLNRWNKLEIDIGLGGSNKREKKQWWEKMQMQPLNCQRCPYYTPLRPEQTLSQSYLLLANLSLSLKVPMVSPKMGVVSTGNYP